MVGDFAAAEEYIQRSLAVACGTGQHGLHLRTLVVLARFDRMVGHFAAARKWRGETAGRFCPARRHLFQELGRRCPRVGPLRLLSAVIGDPATAATRQRGDIAAALASDGGRAR